MEEKLNKVEQDRQAAAIPELLDNQQWALLRKKYQMTRRELQIAQLICRGMSNDQAAEALGVKLGTVKTHIRNLYRKLWVHNKISMLLRFIDDAGVIIKKSESPMDMMLNSGSSRIEEPSMS